MMSETKTVQHVRLLALLAGGMDFVTGLGLVLQPEITLRLMWVSVPGAEALIYVRFVGVFVAAVGFTYLWALMRDRIARARKQPLKGHPFLRGALRFTMPFRVGAGTFCLTGVSQGWLPVMWLSVTVVDYGLLLVQGYFLLRRWEEKAQPAPGEDEREDDEGEEEQQR